MKLPTLLTTILEALRSAGATEEMIAAAVKASGESQTPHRGRPRRYATRALRDRAYRERKKARDEMRVETLTERPVDAVARVASLKGMLVDAAAHNIDLSADIEPIRRLLDQGYDLDADVLPTVARTVPELPRPLKNWGAQWLVREILAAREQRLNRFADSVKALSRT